MNETWNRRMKAKVTVAYEHNHEIAGTLLHVPKPKAVHVVRVVVVMLIPTDRTVSFTR